MLFKEADLGTLQTYIIQLQAAKAASNGLFNTTAAQSYAAAIQGLEAKQAALLLSTQGLTNAQIAETLAVNESNIAANYQAMADAGLLARKQKLTLAQVQENLQTVLGSEADAKAAMASMGLSASTETQIHKTVKLSAAKLQEAVNTNILTEAQAQELAMRTGVTFSMKAQAASTLPKWIATVQAATKAIWGQVKATAVWLATTPAGWATAAVAAIGAVIAGLNKLAKAEKKASDAAMEAYNKSKDKVESNKEEAKSLDELIDKYAELKSSSDMDTNNRNEIKELQYDIMELVGAEVKNLDLVNGALDDQLAKLKEIAAEKARQNAEDARDSYYQSRQVAAKLTGNYDDYGNDASISEAEIQEFLGISYNTARGTSGKYVGGKWQTVQWADILSTFTEQFGDIVRDDKNPLSRNIVVDTTGIDNIEDKIRRLEEFKDFIHDMGLHKSDFYSSIVESISYYETQYSSELEAADNLVNAVIDDLSVSSRSLKEMAVDSIDIFEQYRQTMISEVKRDEDIGEAIADGLLSDEAIEKAVNNFMATTDGFSEWYVKWQESLTDTAESKSSSFDLTTYKDQIDNIQSSVSTLRSALESFNKGDLSKIQVIDLMQEFPDLVPYIDLTADGFGNLSEGLSKLIAQQPDSLIQSLKQLKASLATDEERQQVELLIDSLQRLSSYGDTGIESYATTIGNTWSDTANVIEGVTTQFENLAKVQEAVADGLTMTATQAAELAKMYPEILTNAEVSASGQITLNEGVVKSILDGDQSIIDAQITKLEADKAELTSKKDFAEAQLEIVKQVGEGEGQISKEVAVYKLDNLNKQLQAVADSNTEEDEVVAETAKNMAGNMHEYNTVVGNVAQNTSDNIGKAASSMADSISKNSVKAQQSIENIQKKAWDVADSIKDMSTGKHGGKSGIYGSSGSTQTEAIEITIDTGNFEARQASYNVVEIDFDEFQLELETTIQGYLDAISNIDSQIEILKNLQATFDENGGVGGHGYANQLEQLEREKEELNNALKDTTSSSTKETKQFSEELNWIEKIVHKVSSSLDKLKDKVSNTYIGWSIRNHSLSKAMGKTNEAIHIQQQAYEKYMQKAASVGLSQEYVDKIQNGSLNIELITDESLSDKIKEYETWYDKAMECSDAIEELRTELSELAKQRFDNINKYFSGLMDTTEKSISKLETKENNTFKSPNAKVYSDLYAETQNLINYNTQRVQQLEEALDSAVNSGYIEAGSEAWRDMYNEILDVRNATEEYKIELQDISKRKYEAILKPIQQELIQQEQRNNIIEKMQDRLALQGYVEAKGLYERQLRDSESKLQTLREQADQLQQNMQDALSKGMEIGSDEWADMKSSIDENVISVMELENSMIELNNALRDLEWDKFDRFQKSISRITGESDFMIGMFDKDDAYDDDGKLTEEGSAVIGLHAQNYFVYKEQAKAYKDEVDKINKELIADPTNTTLIDRKNDLVDAYQNATKAAYDEYEAVIELGKEGYQAQIDSIQDLIDAKKKQLEADKSLYEYQKNIAEKTKNIADIQKQLSALANDDSEENRAKIQKLKVDLTDAQKDLEDTQYDKWYNDQQDMLDRLAEEYAALISEQSQNEQEIFQEMVEYTNANAQKIQDTISTTAQEWGYVFNHGIDSVLEPGLTGITDIGQNIYEEIQRLYQLNERMYKVSADLADLGVTDYGLETTISDEDTARNFIERLYNGLLGRHSDEDGLNFWMDRLMNGATVQEMLEGFLNSDEYTAMGKSASDTILDFYRGLLGREAETEGYNHWIEQYRKGMSLSEIGTHGFLDSDEFLSRDFWLNLLDAKTAISNVTEKTIKPEFTPVDMSEFIDMLREKSAAAKGISVEELKPVPQDLSSIFNLKNAPQLNLSTLPQTSNITNMGNTVGEVHNTITFAIDRVLDYNDLVTQMQKDGKFEKMIEDMTIGKLAGRSSINKNRYKWG